MLRKHFLHPAGYGSVFPAKSCQDAWNSGSPLARGQVNMLDEANLWFIQLLKHVVQHVFRIRYYGEKQSSLKKNFYVFTLWKYDNTFTVDLENTEQDYMYFHYILELTHSAAGVQVFGASHLLAEHTSQMDCFCQDSESCSGLDWQQTTKWWPWPFLGASLTLGSALELLLGPMTELVIAGCHRQSRWEMFAVVEYSKRKQQFFWFVVSSWDINLSRFPPF